MKSADSDQPEAVRKSFEIAYALFRIGNQVAGNQSYTNYLHAYALELLNSAIRQDYRNMERYIQALDYVLRLGGDAGIIGNRNSEMVIAELGKLNSAIAELSSFKGDLEVDIESIFEPIQAADKKSNVPSDRQSQTKQSNTEKREDAEVVNNKEREVVIIEIIRQFGNCRMKDIQDGLPNLSERTLRYELKDLVLRGMVEKVGTAGPGTFYRLKTGQTASQATSIVPKGNAGLMVI